MKILILTCCDGNWRKNSLSRINETKKKLADRFDGIDYKFELRRTDKSTEPQWEKLKMCLDHLDDGYDFLMWMDDDAGFIKFDDFRPLLENLDKDKYAFFTIERTDDAGREFGYLNSGVFFVRPCEESKKMLEWAWEQRKLPKKFTLCDQPVLIKWFFSHKDGCGVVDGKVFNSFPDCFCPRQYYANPVMENTIVVHLASRYMRNPEYLSKWFPVKEEKKPTEQKRTTGYEGMDDDD